MKRLISLLLFLTCHFLLPLQQKEMQPGPAGAGSFSAIVSGSTSSGIHLTNIACQHANPWRELFKRRPVGLNDGHEQALPVYSINIRPLFVYVHTPYRTYTQNFRNAAINLSDWRGPPITV